MHTSAVILAHSLYFGAPIFRAWKGGGGGGGGGANWALPVS